MTNKVVGPGPVYLLPFRLTLLTRYLKIKSIGGKAPGDLFKRSFIKGKVCDIEVRSEENGSNTTWCFTWFTHGLTVLSEQEFLGLSGNRLLSGAFSDLGHTEVLVLTNVTKFTFQERGMFFGGRITDIRIEGTLEKKRVRQLKGEYKSPSEG